MPEELAEGAESVELDKSVGDTLEEVSVLIGFEELAEGARSVELDESVRDMLEEVSVLVGSSELVEETRSVELDDSVTSVLEEASVVGEAISVELEESAEVVSESLVEDKESTNVLVTLETLVSVELTGMKESELVGELVALVEESVRKLDVVALTLEGPVLDTLSVVDEMEVFFFFIRVDL